MIRDSKQSSPRKLAGRHSTTKFLLSLLVVTSSVFVFAQPASATDSPLSGTQEVGGVVYYDTPRTNSQVQNVVSIQQLTNNAGGGMSVAIRPGLAATGTYARGTSVGTQFVRLRHDNGQYWVSWGTFYTSVQLSGGCGGSGCGAVSFSGTIRYNIPY
jgi:hypothetical protein